MSRKQRIKYRVIPEKLMKDLVEFIDEVQFEATKVSSVENHHLINLANYLVSCLINSDSFTEDIGGKEPEDFFTYDMGDMTEEEYEKLLDAFDSFMFKYKKETNKETKKTKHKHKHIPKQTLKKFESDLRRDVDLTAEEKFELYYDEHCKRKDKDISFDDLLNNLGIENPNKK